MGRFPWRFNSRKNETFTAKVVIWLQTGQRTINVKHNKVLRVAMFCRSLIGWFWAMILSLFSLHLLTLNDIQYGVGSSKKNCKKTRKKAFNSSKSWVYICVDWHWKWWTIKVNVIKVGVTFVTWSSIERSMNRVVSQVRTDVASHNHSYILFYF